MWPTEGTVQGEDRGSLSVEDCIMPKKGIFCRVLQGGPVRSGDPVRILPRD